MAQPDPKLTMEEIQQQAKAAENEMSRNRETMKEEEPKSVN